MYHVSRCKQPRENSTYTGTLSSVLFSHLDTCTVNRPSQETEPVTLCLFLEDVSGRMLSVKRSAFKRKTYMYVFVHIMDCKATQSPPGGWL